MDKKIIEGNKLIALFDGATITYPIGYCRRTVEFESVTHGLRVHNEGKLEYHTSWDWIMGVVEKIEAIRDKDYGWFQVCIQSNTCSIQSQHLWRHIQGLDGNEKYKAYCSDPNAIFPTKIESTWYAVVEFLTWLNANKTKDNAK